jgi:hypothetical protein
MIEIIRVLSKKRDELLAEAHKLGVAIAALGNKKKPIRKRRAVSAIVRKRMSVAAKARWAKKRAKAAS